MSCRHSKNILQSQQWLITKIIHQSTHNCASVIVIDFLKFKSYRPIKCLIGESSQKCHEWRKKVSKYLQGHNTSFFVSGLLNSLVGVHSNPGKVTNNKKKAYLYTKCTSQTLGSICWLRMKLFKSWIHLCRKTGVFTSQSSHLHRVNQDMFKKRD